MTIQIKIGKKDLPRYYYNENNINYKNDGEWFDKVDNFMFDIEKKIRDRLKRDDKGRFKKAG